MHHYWPRLEPQSGDLKLNYIGYSEIYGTLIAWCQFICIMRTYLVGAPMYHIGI